MKNIDIASNPRDDLMTFMRRANELAVSDFNDGVRSITHRSPKQIMDNCHVSHHRGFQEDLGVSVYNGTMLSLVAAVD